MMKKWSSLLIAAFLFVPVVMWSSDTIYVSGHKHPDTDATCSAIAYARLMCQLGNNCRAVVPGKINNETKFVLSRFGFPVPPVLGSAAGKQIILTDHSEMAQSLLGLDQANVVQIIDHHALGSVTTQAPLYYLAMPVGSTCTIVYMRYKNLGVEITQDLAGIMLSAILSDTENLTSSIVTPLDSAAVADLLPISGIVNLPAYYQQMSDSAASYCGYTDLEIAQADYKNDNSVPGKGIGVCVVNTQGKENHEAVRTRIAAVLPEVLKQEKRAMVFALIENKTDGYTDILFCGKKAQQAVEKAFGSATNGYVRQNYIMARKKDFMPALKKALSGR